MAEQAKYLSPSQLQARWDGAIKVGTLANWRAKKLGPPFQKFGGRVRYPIAQLVEWEAANLHLIGANDNRKTEAIAK